MSFRDVVHPLFWHYDWHSWTCAFPTGKNPLIESSSSKAGWQGWGLVRVFCITLLVHITTSYIQSSQSGWEHGCKMILDLLLLLLISVVNRATGGGLASMSLVLYSYDIQVSYTYIQHAVYTYVHD